MVKFRDVKKLLEDTYNVKLTKYGVKKLTEFCLINGISQVYDALKICSNNHNQIESLFENIGDIFAIDKKIYMR